MCYFTALDTDEAAFQLRYHRLMLDEPKSRLPYSCTSAATRPWWPVITSEQPGLVAWKQWGLSHFEANDPGNTLVNSSPYNAASEEVDSLHTFKHAMAKGQRCLIPVTAFYEWQHDLPGDPETVSKTPVKITLRDEPLFSLAGLYDGDNFTVLTRPSDTFIPMMDQTRMRKPVIIPRAYEGDWLNPLLDQKDVMRFCTAVEKKDLLAVAYNGEIGPLPLT